MNYFKSGPSLIANDYITIVVKMIHYDKKREFPWDEYIDTLLQACIVKLAQGTEDNIDTVRGSQISN